MTTYRVLPVIRPGTWVRITHAAGDIAELKGRYGVIVEDGSDDPCWFAIRVREETVFLHIDEFTPLLNMHRYADIGTP